MKRKLINRNFAYCTGKGADYCEFCERSLRYYREAWEAVKTGSGCPEDRGADFITNTKDEAPDCCRAYLPAIVPDDWEDRIPRPKNYHPGTLILPLRRSIVDPTKRRTSKK